jgi:hypothetical protein
MPQTQPVDVTVARLVRAPARTLYGLVSDVTQLGRWSPETVAASWLGPAAGPVVGARFRGRNRLGSARWTTKPTVTVADPGRCFAFELGAAGEAE